MAFSIRNIQDELARSPLVSPYPEDLAVAVISDVFRRAGQRPASLDEWKGFRTLKVPRLLEQSGMLAWAFHVSSLAAETVARPVLPPAGDVLGLFFISIEPLTAELIRSNTFRQEEFLRKWVLSVGGSIEGESPEESQRRLSRLDYGNALKEFERARKARLEEARIRREKEEAERRAAEARGWQE
ncbi:MAG: hypothetical protein IT186_19270 [Acidobacteria bacterium]|nr:hypothetical protein [Acidobacteriota bacterium]MCG3192031.1 hypothetical protein [Thermoanaerobaculia bacterium]MCK6684765.1 hypothetical protein [Thermoanaerobaculia bacterium]